MIETLHGKLSTWQVWWPYTLWQWRYYDFSLPPDLVRPSDRSAIWLYERRPLKISHHSGNFGGFKHSDIEDITIFDRHVISQDHVLKGLCDFMVRNPSKESTM